MKRRSGSDRQAGIACGFDTRAEFFGGGSGGERTGLKAGDFARWDDEALVRAERCDAAVKLIP